MQGLEGKSINSLPEFARCKVIFNPDNGVIVFSFEDPGAILGTDIS